MTKKTNTNVVVEEQVVVSEPETPVIKKSLKEIREEWAEKKRQREADQAKYDAVGLRLGRFFLKAGESAGIRPLHKLAYALPMLVHQWYGTKPIFSKCKEHDNIDCELCTTKVWNDKKQEFVKLSRDQLLLMVGYNYSNLGKTYPAKGSDGKIVQKPKSPIVLVTWPLGKNDANISGIKMADKLGVFTQNIFNFSRPAEGGYDIVMYDSPDDFKKVVGPDVTLELSDEALKITQMSESEISQLIHTMFREFVPPTQSGQAPIATPQPKTVISPSDVFEIDTDQSALDEIAF